MFGAAILDFAVFPVKTRHFTAELMNVLFKEKYKQNTVQDLLKIILGLE